ncbi:MAG: hypothetical protein ACRC0Y_00525 [Fusobacteriaceae bacterium]
MRKNIIIAVFMAIFSFAFSEIKIKIVEPLRFRDINHTEIGPNQVVAVSHIEVYTTDKNKDLGKRVTFKFPEYINLTNRKKWIKVEKVGMDRKQNEIILYNERELIKIYAILDRRELDRGEEIENIEGEYVGQLPIVMGIYSFVQDKPQILPVFPDEVSKK